MKTKYPAVVASAVALEIVTRLSRCCSRIEVAGSLRRGKREVGDIEIVYVAHTTTKSNPEEMFGDAPLLTNLAEQEIARMLSEGIINTRRSVAGSVAWGSVNKLAAHVASGVPVDLFATSEECWFNYLVCRTGGAENNKNICMAAQRRGWKWNPYGSGFTNNNSQEQSPIMRSERDVFEFVGLPYLEPKDRP